jgi:hypothetical protein
MNITCKNGIEKIAIKNNIASVKCDKVYNYSANGVTEGFDSNNFTDYDYIDISHNIDTTKLNYQGLSNVSYDKLKSLDIIYYNNKITDIQNPVYEGNYTDASKYTEVCLGARYFRKYLDNINFKCRNEKYPYVPENFVQNVYYNLKSFKGNYNTLDNSYYNNIINGVYYNVLDDLDENNYSYCKDGNFMFNVDYDPDNSKIKKFTMNCSDGSIPIKKKVDVKRTDIYVFKGSFSKIKFYPWTELYIVYSNIYNNPNNHNGFVNLKLTDNIINEKDYFYLHPDYVNQIEYKISSNKIEYLNITYNNNKKINIIEMFDSSNKLNPNIIYNCTDIPNILQKNINGTIYDIVYCGNVAGEMVLNKYKQENGVELESKYINSGSKYIPINEYKKNNISLCGSIDKFNYNIITGYMSPICDLEYTSLQSDVNKIIFYYSDYEIINNTLLNKLNITSLNIKILSNPIVGFEIYYGKNSEYKNLIGNITNKNLEILLSNGISFDISDTLSNDIKLYYYGKYKERKYNFIAPRIKEILYRKITYNQLLKNNDDMIIYDIKIPELDLYDNIIKYDNIISNNTQNKFYLNEEKGVIFLPTINNNIEYKKLYNEISSYIKNVDNTNIPFLDKLQVFFNYIKMENIKNIEYTKNNNEYSIQYDLLYNKSLNYVSDIFNIKIIPIETNIIDTNTFDDNKSIDNKSIDIESIDIKTEPKIIESVFSYILFFIVILILVIYLDYNKIVSKNRIFEYIYKKI